MNTNKKKTHTLIQHTHSHTCDVHTTPILLLNYNIKNRYSNQTNDNTPYRDDLNLIQKCIKCLQYIKTTIYPQGHEYGPRGSSHRCYKDKYSKGAAKWYNANNFTVSKCIDNDNNIEKKLDNPIILTSEYIQNSRYHKDRFKPWNYAVYNLKLKNKKNENGNDPRYKKKDFNLFLNEQKKRLSKYQKWQMKNLTNNNNNMKVNSNNRGNGRYNLRNIKKNNSKNNNNNVKMSKSRKRSREVYNKEHLSDSNISDCGNNNKIQRLNNTNEDTDGENDIKMKSNSNNEDI